MNRELRRRVFEWETKVPGPFTGVNQHTTGKVISTHTSTHPHTHPAEKGTRHPLHKPSGASQGAWMRPPEPRPVRPV